MSDAPQRVGAIVLAAGASSRMGRNKMLHLLDGETLARRAARRCVEAGFDPVVVVVGRDADEVAASLEGVTCTVIHNSDAGPTSTSLHLGLRALPANVDAATIVLGDMPRVTTTMLRTVLDCYRDRSPLLVASRYGDAFAPPQLFSRPLFDELLACDGDGCGKQVLMQHLRSAELVDWPSDAVRDVDVAADYEALSDGPASSH